MRKKIGIALFMCLSCAVNAHAGGCYIAPALGYDVFTGDAGRLSDDGLSYGLCIGYRLNESIDLECNVLYSSHDDVVDNQGATTVDIWSGLIGPKFIFPFQGTRPYISAGMGLYPLNFRFEPENTGRSPRTDDDTESGVYAGVGIDLPLSDTMFLGFDIKYHHIFNDNILDGDMIGTQLRVGFAVF